MQKSVDRRRWLFRLLAILLGLLPFALLEIGLRAYGYQATPRIDDPFIEFASSRSLFELNETRERYVTAASRKPFFKTDSFAARKSPDEYRIFCLGGSTVQGNPYSIETSFTTWLELSLTAADPSRKWEVVNCGGISYASYRLAPILRECLQYQPDLFVLYVGDNEFLEERTYAEVKQAHPTSWIFRQAARSKVFQLVRSELLEHSPSRTPSVTKAVMPAEVEALLDYKGGLEKYHRDDKWRADVARHFQFTLQSMVREAQQANVPVLLIDPVSNIRDCPPFKVEIDSQLSESERQQLTEHLAEAEQAEDLESRIDCFKQVLKFDAQHAGALFLLGHAYLEAGEQQEAKAALFRAKDADVCPLRMTEPLRRVIHDISQSTKVPLVPVLTEFELRSQYGIPGDDFLLDHVHPKISGHQIIAELIVTSMAKRGWVNIDLRWHFTRNRLYDAHLKTLDTPYYARGREHLEGLQKWAQGRVTKLRTKSD